MTPEQSKQLKKGDEIFILARYKMILDNGNVLFSHSLNYVCDREAKTESYTHHSNVIFPPSTPKYDPCRLFKAGDEAKKRVVNGRSCSALREQVIYKVIENETEAGNVALVSTEAHDSHRPITVKAVFLELVTPVEELEPYSVGESSDYFSVDKGDEEFCLYWKDKHPHAKEAAEAESDRLNAEYRKNQDNGLGH